MDPDKLARSLRLPLIDKSFAELQRIAAETGMPRFAAKQMSQWLHERQVATIEGMTNLSKAAREALSQRYETGIREPLRQVKSSDGTEKFLFPTSDGQQVEAVYIPEEDRGTVCLSTQVGCKMHCRFCQTGRQGWQGDLSAADILSQAYWLMRERKVTNMVLMGQGEPMDNVSNVLRALRIITEQAGWSPHRITVSTVGVRAGLERFLAESSCHLAVSLHSAIPAQRRQLMPAEGGMPIAEVVELLRGYDFSHQRRLSFEYLLLKGVNDSPLHAKEVAKLLRGLDCRVNLIRYHDIGDTEWQAPDEQTLIAFRDYLTKHGTYATIRRSRGEDISAACGMLNTLPNAGRPT